jgi:hypothetical protein
MLPHTARIRRHAPAYDLQADNYQCCAPFMERVSAEDVPDYYEIVTNPMDLNTVITSPCTRAHACSCSHTRTSTTAICGGGVPPDRASVSDGLPWGHGYRGDCFASLRADLRAAQVKRKIQKYDTHGEFAHDMRLIFSNCVAYNTDPTSTVCAIPD